MWTPTSIQAMLASTGLPASCGPFPDEADSPVPAPPFLVWDVGGADVYADDSNFAPFGNLLVELYTRHRDFPRERAVEEVFRASGLAWDKETDTMGKPRLHVTTWIMTVPMEGGGDGD